MNKYGEILFEIISNISDKYQKNELAYLSLTSKAENPIRDKIAFELQKKLSENKIVCREWKNGKTNTKADIAIINNKGKLECLIEFKAHSAIKRIEQWNKSLIKDFNKSLLIDDKVETIFILLANFTNKLPANETFKNVIKYYSDISKSIEKKYTKEKVITEWKNALRKLKIKCDLKITTIDAGKFERNKVEIQVFIHENIRIT